MAFTNRRGRTQTALAEINVTPLVDVMLVLLVIFMVTAPILQTGIQVNLPHTQSTSAIAVSPHIIIVTIDSKSNIYLSVGSNKANTPVNIHDLSQLVSQEISKGQANRVYIRADG